MVLSLSADLSYVITVVPVIHQRMGLGKSRRDSSHSTRDTAYPSEFVSKDGAVMIRTAGAGLPASRNPGLKTPCSPFSQCLFDTGLCSDKLLPTVQSWSPSQLTSLLYRTHASCYNAFLIQHALGTKAVLPKLTS